MKTHTERNNTAVIKRRKSSRKERQILLTHFSDRTRKRKVRIEPRRDVSSSFQASKIIVVKGREEEARCCLAFGGQKDLWLEWKNVFRRNWKGEGAMGILYQKKGISLLDDNRGETKERKI